jgi:RNA methyltransferase, TrmH family
MQLMNNRITSTQNPRIKSLVKLRKASVRKESGLFLIEGVRELSRALEGGIVVREIYTCEERLNQEETALCESLINSGVEAFSLAACVFEKIAYREHPGGLVAVAEIPTSSLNSIRLGPCPLILVVEGVEKPGNLGAILRTSDAAGVDAVLVCGGVVDLFNPNVVRASLGTLFSQPVIEADTGEVITWLQENNIKAVVATPEASVNYCECNMTGATALVAGSESMGLTNAWKADIGESVSIPMAGSADSLNVSNSVAVLLYEAVRQRNKN